MTEGRHMRWTITVIKCWGSVSWAPRPLWLQDMEFFKEQKARMKGHSRHDRTAAVPLYFGLFLIPALVWGIRLASAIVNALVYVHMSLTLTGQMHGWTDRRTDGWIVRAMVAAFLQKWTRMNLSTAWKAELRAQKARRRQEEWKLINTDTPTSFSFSSFLEPN